MLPDAIRLSHNLAELRAQRSHLHASSRILHAFMILHVRGGIPHGLQLQANTHSCCSSHVFLLALKARLRRRRLDEAIPPAFDQCLGASNRFQPLVRSGRQLNRHRRRSAVGNPCEKKVCLSCIHRSCHPVFGATSPCAMFFHHCEPKS